jgi:hypothetical protein
VAETRSGTSASACLDLRGNALDAPTRQYRLFHESTGSFARLATTAGNVAGQVVESGTFAPAGSCPRPVF